MCRKMSKSESTIVENGDSQSGTTVNVYCLFAVSDYYAARSNVRRATLDRDRCDTGSVVFVNDSDTVASYLANESIENFQHEENRSAANAREYNRSDHIKHDI
jgi:hypothetical protein